MSGCLLFLCLSVSPYVYAHNSITQIIDPSLFRKHRKDVTHGSVFFLIGQNWSRNLLIAVEMGSIGDMAVMVSETTMGTCIELWQIMGLQSIIIQSYQMNQPNFQVVLWFAGTEYLNVQLIAMNNP
jgi:hypothetical protein